MKKIGFMILLILSLSLLSSCTSSQEDIVVKEESNKNILPQIPADSEIVFFDNQKLFYFTFESDSKTPDLANQTLYEYDIKENKTIKINTFSNIAISSDSKALHQNNFYMHLATNEQNHLVKVDTNTHSSEIIKKWSTFPTFAYVYTLDNNLILFGPNSIGSATEYYINKINLTDNSEVNIVAKKIENQKGELIASLDVDEKFIYAFSIASNGVNETYSIIKYDINGKQLSVYPFDLESFISMKTLLNEDDAIIRIYKEKNYFILNTINGRVFIFKISNDKLEPIKIPEKFFINNPAGYHFLEYYDGDSNYAYFINTFEQNNIIEVFNCETETFTTIKLTEDNNNINKYYRNAKGDLIIKKSNKQDIYKIQYIYENSPFDKK